MRRWWWRTMLGAGAAAMLAAGAGPEVLADEEKTYEFTVVNVGYQGTKMFVPSVLVVEKGSQVKIKIINRIPGEPAEHGFAIPAFGVETVVKRGETKEVEFSANKEGIFIVKCQLHPAHVHAQLVVMDD